MTEFTSGSELQRRATREANRRRHGRSLVKQQIAAVPFEEGCDLVVAFLRECRADSLYSSMSLWQLIVSLRQVGRLVAVGYLAELDIGRDKTVGSLTDRQVQAIEVTLVTCRRKGLNALR